MTIRRVAAAAAAAAALTALAACTHSSPAVHSSGATSSTAAAVPALHAAWTAPLAARWRPDIISTTAWGWTTADSVVVPGTRSLTSYALGAGTTRWTLPLAQDICTIAPAPTASGIGVVMTGHSGLSDSQACATVVAVDLSTGKQLWTAPVAKASSYGFTDVVAGDDDVVATNDCDAVLSLATRTGARRFTVRAHAGDGCRYSFASDGRTIVGSHLRSGHDTLVGYDATTGRQRFSRPVAGDAGHPHDALPEVRRVVDSDPLVVDASVNQHRFLRTVDPSGATTLFGRESSDSYPPVFVAPVGADLAVQYGQSGQLFTYDPHSGRQTGHAVLAAGELAVGVRGTQLISLALGTRGAAQGKFVAVATDAHSGARSVLGRVSAPSTGGVTYSASVAGSTLVVAGDSTLSAYRLPARGGSAAAVGDPATYAKGELSAATAVDLCLGVSTAAQRELGFPDPSLPAPSGCRWVETEKGGGIVQLSVATSAIAASGRQTGAQGAHRNVTQLSAADSTNRLPALTPLPGVGDEAGVVVRTKDPLVRVVARRLNVVISVDVTQDAAPGDAAVSPAALRRGAVQAAKDVVAEIDRRR